MSNDGQHLAELKQLFSQHQHQIGTIVSRWHLDILSWLTAKTQWLDVLDNVTAATRVYCILNDIYDFPCCKTCGKQMQMNVTSAVVGFQKEHCSVKCVSSDPIVKAQREQTTFSRFGYPSCFKSDSVKAQSQHTMLQRYGAKYAMQSDICKEKYAATSLKAYGAKWHIASDTIKQKISAANVRQLGVDNPWKCRKVQDKCRQKYIYDSIRFDSAPEIAFYVWLTDHGIEFEYQPNIQFAYEHNGRRHFYVPDFRIGNQLIELKGDQFLLVRK